VVQLIAEMATQHAGEVLCGELIRRGFDPVRLQVIPGGGEAVIVLSIIEPWSKAVKLPRDQLTPEAVELALETWKQKVRADLQAGTPSEVIKQAIRQFGSEAVARALEPKVAIA